MSGLWACNYGISKIMSIFPKFLFTILSGLLAWQYNETNQNS